MRHKEYVTCNEDCDVMKIVSPSGDKPFWTIFSRHLKMYFGPFFTEQKAVDFLNNNEMSQFTDTRWWTNIETQIDAWKKRAFIKGE